MSVLCSLGLHRWKYEERTVGEKGRTRTRVTTARCKRKCPKYGRPIVVHSESLVAPGLTDEVFSVPGHSTSARKAAPAGELTNGEEPWRNE